MVSKCPYLKGHTTVVIPIPHKRFEVDLYLDARLLQTSAIYKITDSTPIILVSDCRNNQAKVLLLIYVITQPSGLTTTGFKLHVAMTDTSYIVNWN